jgi:hypothetical protein
MTQDKERFNYYPKYIAKPIEVGEFVKGECFLCRLKEGMQPDGYVHFQCAMAFEKEKKKIIDSFLKKDNKETK